MTTIVMNTATGAVSEYDWAFQSITPTHAGDATGLYLLGGDSDGTAGDPVAPVPIDGTFMCAKTLLGSSKKKGVDMVYLGIQGAGAGLLRVAGAGGAWEYPVQVLDAGMSRAKPGMGIRENYLGLGYRNVAGAAFRIDRLEAIVPESKTRRV